MGGEHLPEEGDFLVKKGVGWGSSFGSIALRAAAQQRGSEGRAAAGERSWAPARGGRVVNWLEKRAGAVGGQRRPLSCSRVTQGLPREAGVQPAVLGGASVPAARRPGWAGSQGWSWRLETQRRGVLEQSCCPDPAGRAGGDVAAPAGDGARWWVLCRVERRSQHATISTPPAAALPANTSLR